MNWRHLLHFFVLLHLLGMTASCDVVRYADRRAERIYRSRGGKPQQIRLGNTLLSYRVAGRKGEPILMLHGFGPNPKLQWVRQIKPLARRHRLIVPDLVYFGDSRLLTDRRPYSPEFQADQMRALLDTLGLDRVHLMGISYGGVVASLFYVKNPDRVDRVVLADAPVKYYTRAYADSLAQTYGRPSAAELLLPARGEELTPLLEAVLHDPPKLKPQWRDTIVRRYYFEQRHDKEELLRYLYRSETFLNSLVYRTGRPTLLLWGEHDRLIPVDVGRRLQQHIGDNARLVLVPEAGHAPNGENARFFNRVVLDFLETPKEKPAKTDAGGKDAGKEKKE